MRARRWSPPPPTWSQHRRVQRDTTRSRSRAGGSKLGMRTHKGLEKILLPVETTHVIKLKLLLLFPVCCRGRRYICISLCLFVDASLTRLYVSSGRGKRRRAVDQVDTHRRQRLVLYFPRGRSLPSTTAVIGTGAFFISIPVMSIPVTYCNANKSVFRVPFPRQRWHGNVPHTKILCMSVPI